MYSCPRVIEELVASEQWPTRCLATWIDGHCVTAFATLQGRGKHRVKEADGSVGCARLVDTELAHWKAQSHSYLQNV